MKAKIAVYVTLLTTAFSLAATGQDLSDDFETRVFYAPGWSDREIGSVNFANPERNSDPFADETPIKPEEAAPFGPHRKIESLGIEREIWSAFERGKYVAGDTGAKLFGTFALVEVNKLVTQKKTMQFLPGEAVFAGDFLFIRGPQEKIQAVAEILANGSFAEMTINQVQLRIVKKADPENPIREWSFFAYSRTDVRVEGKNVDDFHFTSDLTKSDDGEINWDFHLDATGLPVFTIFQATLQPGVESIFSPDQGGDSSDVKLIVTLDEISVDRLSGPFGDIGRQLTEKNAEWKKLGREYEFLEIEPEKTVTRVIPIPKHAFQENHSAFNRPYSRDPFYVPRPGLFMEESDFPVVDPVKWRAAFGQGQLVDAGPMLEGPGITFRKADFAVYNRSSELLYLRLTEKEMVLMELFMPYLGSTGISMMKSAIAIVAVESDDTNLSFIGLVALPPTQKRVLWKQDCFSRSGQRTRTGGVFSESDKLGETTALFSSFGQLAELQYPTGSYGGVCETDYVLGGDDITADVHFNLQAALPDFNVDFTTSLTLHNHRGVAFHIGKHADGRELFVTFGMIILDTSETEPMSSRNFDLEEWDRVADKIQYPFPDPKLESVGGEEEPPAPATNP